MSDSLSIILPVFNEEGNIQSVIRTVCEYVTGMISDYEIVVVNDGSTDDSAHQIALLQREFLQLHCVTHPLNQGYGAAVRSGIAAASKEWILLTDADGQYDIHDLAFVWEKRMAYDCVFGYRINRHVSDGWYRRALGFVGTVLANAFMHQPQLIRDMNCAFKLFCTADLQAHSFIVQGNMIYCEIVWCLLREGKKYVQIPVTHYSRIKGVQTGGLLRTVAQIITEGIRVLSKPKGRA